MHFALGNLLHDMDMAGYMNRDYFDIEGFPRELLKNKITK